MGDNSDFGVRCHIKVVADIAQSLGRLQGGIVNVVDHFVLRERDGAHQAGQAKGGESGCDTSSE